MRLRVSVVFFSSRKPHIHRPTKKADIENYAALSGWRDIVQPVNNQGVKRWLNVIDELINPFTVFNTTNNNTHCLRRIQN